MRVRVRFVEEWEHMTVRMFVLREVGDRSEWLLDDGSWLITEQGVVAPPNAGLRLPEEAVDAMAEALHPRAGHKVEVTRLEEALAVERERVDRVLAKGEHSG